MIARRPTSPRARRRGFTLIEVTLAVGIFTFAILALLGLFGASLRSVTQVESASRVPAVMGQVQAWLDQATFDDVFNGVAGRSTIELLVYTQAPASAGGVEQTYVVRVDRVTGVAPSWTDAAGPVFKADLIASPMNPRIGADLNLSGTPATWPEGYVAVEVSVYALPAAEPGEALASFRSRVGIAQAPPPGDLASYERFHALTYPAAKNR